MNFKSFNSTLSFIFEGVIGRICLRIPLKRLRSEPWVITLENLNLVITPLKLQDVSDNNNFLYVKLVRMLMGQHFKFFNI